jgi:conjugative transfer region protein TrbK
MATDQTRRSLATLAILFVALCVLSVVARGPRIVDDVAALSRDPQQLRQALRDCRARVATADDPACRAASEAWRRRFFGNDESATRASHTESPAHPQDSQAPHPSSSSASPELHSTVNPSRLIGP